MKKKSLGAALSTVLLLSAAHAQEAAAPAADAAPAAAPGVVVNFGLTSNYKFRGQDQGKNRIAVFGGFDYALSNGFYVGNWNSSINFDPHASIEMDFYGGYKGTFGAAVPDLSYDVGVLQYFYPQNSDNYANYSKLHYNTTELYAAVSYSIATLKYSGTVSNDYFGLGQLASLNNTGTFTGTPKGRYTGYYDLSANYEVMKGLTLNGHVGYTRFASDLRNDLTGPIAKDYADYKFGATYDLGSGFAGAAALVGATERHFYAGGINNPKVILTISKSM